MDAMFFVDFRPNYLTSIASIEVEDFDPKSIPDDDREDPPSSDAAGHW